MVRVRDLLGPGGPLASQLPAYEDRPGQLVMADAVEQALSQERVLLCEAGTGIGKTLAYLVPALLSGRKVVVSTATRALEEQIDGKDLPLIRQTLGIEARSAVMKGLSNYLCLRRYREYGSSAAAADLSSGRHLAILERWIETTSSGDIGEIEGLDEDDPLWHEVSSSSDTRIGSSCRHYDECFVTRMREQAAKAQLVIVNHHLFFADLALRGPHAGGALPPYDAVIFDEAHQLEDAATDFFGVRVSSAKIGTFLRDAQRALEAEGLAPRRGERRRRRGRSVSTAGSPMLAALAGAPIPISTATAGSSKPEGSPVLAAVQECSKRFFEELLRARPRARDGKAELGADAFSGSVLSAYHRLDAAIEAAGAFAESHLSSEGLELMSKRAQQLRDDFAAVVDGARNHVTWAEARAHSVAIGASPIQLADLLKARLFEQVPAIVLTSATLTTAGGFSFVRSRLGIEGEQRSIQELEVPSPFDYRSQALLYVPRDLPEPTDPAWMAAASARIRRLIEASGGGAFVLATSKRVMCGLHAALLDGEQAYRGQADWGQADCGQADSGHGQADSGRGQADWGQTEWGQTDWGEGNGGQGRDARGMGMGGRGRTVMMQGEAPKAVILDRFRQEGNAVLVATMSFWEGVDVPGRALRLVIIDKIPFAVPTDPLVAARSQALADEGKNPFVEYQVPAAAIALKQGFGRLIRTRQDAGIVAILDKRIHTRGYGRLLVSSLPPARRTTDLEEVIRFAEALAKNGDIEGGG